MTELEHQSSPETTSAEPEANERGIKNSAAQLNYELLLIVQRIRSQGGTGDSVPELEAEMLKLHPDLYVANDQYIHDQGWAELCRKAHNVLKKRNRKAMHQGENVVPLQIEFAEMGTPLFISIKTNDDDDDDEGTGYRWENFDDSRPDQVEQWIVRYSKQLQTGRDEIEGAQAALEMIKPYRAANPDASMKQLLEMSRKTGRH